MFNNVYSSRERVRAALTFYGCPPSKIDDIMSTRTDGEWDLYVKDAVEFAKSRDNHNLAGIIVVNL